ncbi:hemagglutinin repeat-containing protein [Paraburkholderia nemoris]|uniref:hemagglutinin repeat-containing protein n=1 Tax=Paraburkholderia nemoris TaxID=2793076 RepID=UPI001B056177|nr:hemagglutinin repeat-containing protein [Paraburkholderia nemoris]CAE6732591.1 hypothetical protein R75777_02139 [Paraburkholderia nemoris]
MNKNIYRVIFNAARGLWTAVQETATGTGKGRSSGTTRRAPSMHVRVGFVDMLSMRHVAFAALCVLGMQPLWADAQVVAAPASGSRPVVGVTANGLPIVQIATPNAAGVSNNPYTQYNVGPSGLILNNSASNVQTQLGGYVTGNPNLGAGSARVIVNQVVGGNASQLLGYTEVAGQRAEVVIANPAGIYCNGCGFINTSRGILTTGTPVFGGTGSLDAFHVTGGQIQIGTAGLNGSNVDQVDLIARSVAINGKAWAGQSLNVVAGNNDVRHSDLNAQSLGPDGNSPGVAIDVAQLGGMYAGKIMLVGTETGVGVNSAGTIASQAGDVQISSQGKITLSGSTSANGNVAISAAGDVANSGSVYATQNTTLNSQGQVTNSSTIAALGNTTVTGASVNSTGSLGAGVDANGNVTGTGNLSVTGSGAVTATGQQMAGGNLALSGSSLNMAGGQTLTKGNASLTATGAGGDTGNIVHTGASLQTSGILTANAAGTVTNDQGQVSAAQLSVTAGGISNRGGTLSQTGAGDTTLTASGAFDNTGGTVTTNAQNTAIRSGSLTNANGTISQAGTGALGIQTGALDNGHGSIGTNGVATIAATSLQNGSGSITSAQALNVASSGNLDNTAGRLEAAGAVNVSGANVQNTAGRIVSGNGDGLTLTATGQITNAAGTTAQGATGGVIGGNGNATINAATLTNSGTVTAAQNLAVTTSSVLDNSGGSMSAATLKANAASLKNANGTISASTVSVTAPQLDNSGGKITANQLNVSAANLTNHNGALTQLGSGAMDVNVSGTLDNSNSGVIQTNSTDLTLAPTTLNNNGGTITHAGTGTLTIDSANGAGAVTNVGGSIISNGRTTLSAGSVDNTSGAIAAQTGLVATVAGALNNTHGQLESNADLSAASGGALTNAGGTIAATGNGSVQAALLMNSGSISAGQNLNSTVTGTLDNSGGTLSAQTVTANAASLKNANGTISADTVSVTAPQLDNSGGKITTNHLALVATNLTNHNGALTQLGSGAMGVNVSGTLDNSSSGVIQTNSTDLTLAPSTLNNNGGTITHAGTGTLSIDSGSGTGSLTNVGGKIVTNGLANLTAGSIDDMGGTVSAQTGLNATVAGALNNTNGQLESSGDLSVASGSAITNTSGTIAALGNNTVQAASLTNSGSITAGQNLNTTVTGTLDNGNGTLSAQAITANAASFKNASGVVSGNAVSMSIAQLDNSSGKITTNQLNLAATNLTNEGGSITQLGTGPMGLGVSGTLDNSNGGVIQTKSTDLTLAPTTLNNNGGTITHAGTGTLSIDTANGTGAVTNVGGSIVSNGQVALNAGSLDDTGGSIGGQSGLSATVVGALNNTRGQLQSNGNLSVTSGAGITNTSGTIAASGNNTLQAASLTNGGSITAGQNLGATVSGMLDNGNGTLSAQAITANAASFRNASGVVSGNAATMSIAQLDNSNGRITTNQLGVTATNLTNEGGSITQLGTGPMGLGVSGTLDNSNGGVIQTNSTDLTLASASVNNNSGTITHAGTGTLTIKPSNGTGSLTNVGGRIVTNGQASVSVGSFDNTGGKLASQSVMTATVQGTLNNTNGRLSSGTGLTATSGGQLFNAGGVIGAGGAATGSTLSLAASSIDNSGGAITNLGNGATTINGGSQIANSNAGSASGMGSISGNGNVTLNATSVSNTQGGQLSGANLQINTGNLDNTAGKIGNVANTTGDVGIATSMLTATSGQINASRNLSVTANTLAGGGTYSAVNDLSLNLQGNFTTSPNYGFSAGHNLSFTLPGTFSNGGALSAVNGLNINAGDIENTGTLAAGGLLTTHSNTLTNTGTIVGGSVSLNATQSLSNLGTAALIGATDSAGTLELLAPDIENRDDTTGTDTQAMTAIYGLGKVVLAGGKDGSGNYTNANLIRNQSALIQSGGDMEIDANQVTNARRVMTTGGFTSAIDPAVLQSLGISLSGCDATYLAACGPGNPQVLGSRGAPTLIGGVPTDPPHGGQWNSTYQYTTYTGTAVANTVTSVSPESQIIAGGNLKASSVGTFQNYWSQVAATGNIASPATLDQNSWQGQSAPQVQVTYSGEYHYDNYDNSEHNWQLPFGDAPFVGSRPGGYAQAAPADIRTYALPAYESSFTAGGTLSGTGVTINNTAGNVGVTPLGLLPGQTVSGSGAGSVSGTIGTNGVGAIGAGAVSGTIGSYGVGGIGAGAVSGSIGTGGGVHPGAVAVQGGRILNSGLANFNNPAIAAATAVKVLNNITVPQGGLFHTDTAPNAPYLVETNPAFTSQQQWLSSDYYFQQMGMNPGQIQMRLGDGFYEQKLVQDQILSMTGKSVLTNYANTQDEFKTLMTSGAALAKSLDLAPGTGLSAEQVSQLTGNAVIMQTQIVDGQSVLVPVVYLAQASQENMGNGPVIAATNIDLQNAQTVTNSGTIKAANSFAISGQSIDSSFGTLQSGGQMSLVTTGDVNLTSATLNAGSLALQAGGNLVLNTAVNTLNQVSDTGATRVTTTLGPVAKIDVTGDATIVTGGDFLQNAGALSVGGNLGMQIGGNWTLGAQLTGEHKVVERANGVSDTDINQAVGSSVKVGGKSNVAVGGDLTASGAQIDLGQGGTIAAKGNVSLGTASATSTVNSNSSGDGFGRSYAETLHTSDQSLTGTSLEGGGTVNIVSGKDITISGSTISLDKGNANLLATGSVNVVAASETHELNSHETHSHSEVVSGSKVASSIDQTMTLSQGSTISADGVNIVSGKDVNVTGSNIVGTNDVTLKAARDVNITTSQDTQTTQTDYRKSEYGFLSGMTVLNQLDGGLQGYSFGARKTTDAQQTTQVTNNGSMIGSLNGNLTVTAGNDLHVTDSTLHAANDVGLAGKTVTIDAAQNTLTQSEQQSFGQTAITGGISNPVLAAAQTANQMRQDAKQTKGDARLEALAAATTGLAAKNAMDAVASDPTAVGGVGINVSLGTSHSNSNSTASSSTSAGSTVSAGHNLTIAAAGAGADSNINVVGSNISAGNNATLNAEGNINLQAAQNFDSQMSTNSGSSASIGVTFGVGSQNGISFQLGVSGTKGNGNGSDTTWTNTHVDAGNTLTLQSGGDTNLKGAVADGQQVIANVGGNLNIESLQDVSHYDSKQTSGGVSISVCVPPICAGTSSVSANFNQQKMNSDYASVSEQSGIKAGDGGFQINVQGNTDLKGAVIASSDKAVQDGVNTLTTATLTHSDIENHAAYDASSLGVSGGYGGTIGKDQKGVANNSNPVPGSTLPSAGGLSAAPPVVLGASGDAGSTTNSAISGGAITITDGAKQQQLTGQTAAEAVASISRDTTGTTNTIAPIFDKDKIQAGFDITSQLINQAGTFVSNRAKEADAAKKAANDPNLTPDQRAAAQQQADQLSAEWGPGGSYRQILTALTVAAGGNVTGGMGQFAQSTTVTYLQELGANRVKQIADSLGNDTARAALHAIVGCAGAAASSGSCGAGAMGAAASSVLNSLLGPSDGLTVEQRNARVDAISSLVAGVAGAGGNASTVSSAAQIETENNGASGTPGNNQAQNKQFRSIVAELGLSKEQARGLHDEITGQNLGYHEIRAIAIDMFGNGK